MRGPTMPSWERSWAPTGRPAKAVVGWSIRCADTQLRRADTTFRVNVALLRGEGDSTAAVADPFVGETFWTAVTTACNIGRQRVPRGIGTVAVFVTSSTSTNTRAGSAQLWLIEVGSSFGPRCSLSTTLALFAFELYPDDTELHHDKMSGGAFPRRRSTRTLPAAGSLSRTCSATLRFRPRHGFTAALRCTRRCWKSLHRRLRPEVGTSAHAAIRGLDARALPPPVASTTCWLYAVKHLIVRCGQGAA